MIEHRNNGEIIWEDQVALEAMKIMLTGFNMPDQIDKRAADHIAERCYGLTESMWNERQQDEHNPK